mmetsp:Transcript_3184/g.9232  ORF Transcript_3184/g.9232 Transcript_3184/m.9232 type:complete len:214 (-) Transcript_3184:298-939(-)
MRGFGPRQLPAWEQHSCRRRCTWLGSSMVIAETPLLPMPQLSSCPSCVAILIVTTSAQPPRRRWPLAGPQGTAQNQVTMSQKTLAVPCQLSREAGVNSATSTRLWVPSPAPQRASPCWWRPLSRAGMEGLGTSPSTSWCSTAETPEPSLSNRKNQGMARRDQLPRCVSPQSTTPWKLQRNWPASRRMGAWWTAAERASQDLCLVNGDSHCPVP